MALIDFHCHLDLYPDPAAAVAEAVAAKAYVLSVTTTPSAFRGTAALAPPGGRIQTALGLHPELAAARRHELALFEQLLPLTAYVGEVGLDGSPPHRGSIDAQAGVLTDILGMCAAAGGRTISLHSRGAADLLLDILEMEPLAGRFVLHWFSAPKRTIARAESLGCWFSVGAPMLTSRSGRDAALAMPRDRLLPETDGPFGQIDARPVRPTDGYRTYTAVAELFCEPAAAVERRFTENFRRIAGASTMR